MNMAMKGKRIECIRMEDQNPVPPGTQGTVQFQDDMGTIHVQWDNGRTLGLVRGVDSYKLLK